MGIGQLKGATPDKKIKPVKVVSTLFAKRFSCLSPGILLFCLISAKALAVEGEDSRLRRGASPEGVIQGSVVTSRGDELRRTLEQVRNIKLVKELNLPEEKATVVLGRLRRISELQNSYNQQRQSVVTQLQKIIGSSNPEQGTLQATLRELKDIETNYTNERERTRKEIYDVLTPQQRAQYILFQQKFQDELRQAITDVKKSTQGINTPESGTSTSAPSGTSVSGTSSVGGTAPQRPREGTVLQNRRR